MIPDHIYEGLLAAVSIVGADMTSECEEFLLDIRSEFSGTDLEFVEYVRANVQNWFRCLSSYPEWIQNAEWQFHNGKPMVFVGQLDVPVSMKLFHDDAAVFVFISLSGLTKNVVQVA